MAAERFGCGMPLVLVEICLVVGLTIMVTIMYEVDIYQGFKETKWAVFLKITRLMKANYDMIVLPVPFPAIIFTQHCHLMLGLRDQLLTV